jgi:hypothetical protein
VGAPRRPRAARRDERARRPPLAPRRRPLEPRGGGGAPVAGPARGGRVGGARAGERSAARTRGRRAGGRGRRRRLRGGPGGPRDPQRIRRLAGRRERRRAALRGAAADPARDRGVGGGRVPGGAPGARRRVVVAGDAGVLGAVRALARRPVTGPEQRERRGRSRVSGDGARPRRPRSRCSRPARRECCSARCAAGEGIWRRRWSRTWRPTRWESSSPGGAPVDGGREDPGVVPRVLPGSNGMVRSDGSP